MLQMLDPQSRDFYQMVVTVSQCVMWFDKIGEHKFLQLVQMNTRIHIIDRMKQ